MSMNRTDMAARAVASTLAPTARGGTLPAPPLEVLQICKNGMRYARSFTASQRELWAALQAAAGSSNGDRLVVCGVAEERV